MKCIINLWVAYYNINSLAYDQRFLVCLVDTKKAPKCLGGVELIGHNIMKICELTLWHIII